MNGVGGKHCILGLLAQSELGYGRKRGKDRW